MLNISYWAFIIFTHQTIGFTVEFNSCRPMIGFAWPICVGIFIIDRRQSAVRGPCRICENIFVANQSKYCL